MKNAVFYARVSSALQEKERTIESQISVLKKQIDSSGYKLVKEYIDDGFSGAMLSRPGMDKLRNDLKQNVFDAIYFHNTDRIARDVTYQNIIIGEILRHKKQIIINGEDYVNNPENKFTLTVLGAVSELERAKTIERVMRGRQYRLKQGHLLGHGNHIFGYKYIPRSEDSFPSYLVNEDEANIVRYMFERYVRGDIGYNSLAEDMKREGFLARDGKANWYGTKIKYMIQNETYTGTKYFNKMTDTNALGKHEHRVKNGKRVDRERTDWIGIKIPAIISKGLFNKVQTRINYNRKCYRNAKENQLLSNLVVCGACGTRCFANRNYYKVKIDNKTHIYKRATYRCTSRTAGIHNPEIHSRILENCVMDLIRKYLFDPDKLTNCIDVFKKENKDDQSKLKKKINNIVVRIKIIEKQRKRIIDLYSLGDLNREDYIERTRSYESEIESLKLKQKKLHKSLPILSSKKKLKKYINNYSVKAKLCFDECNNFEYRRQFILNHVNRVEYKHVKGKDTVSLFGSAPINDDRNQESTKLDFKIQNVIIRKEEQDKLREIDFRNKSINGDKISFMEYGELIDKNTPVLP